MIRFEDLLEKVRAYSPDADVELLRRAYVFSAFEHRGQVRHSGEPYLIHPLAVADFLADMKLDVVAIAAGLLHDVVEDTLTTIERIQELFGPEVAHVVEGVTKISAMPFSSSEERQAENFRKMLLAMVDDIRVILVKLADRLHNMRTLNHLSDEKRIQVAQETRDIYAPIANRLGMSKVKNELEELSFRYLEPQAYEALRARVDAKRRQTEGSDRRAQEDRCEETCRCAGAGHRDRRPYQAPVEHQPETPEATDRARTGLRLHGAPHRHRQRQRLLRGARHHPPDLVAGSRPDQGLHRDAAPQRVSVAAHVGHQRARHARSKCRFARSKCTGWLKKGIAAHWKYKEGRIGDHRDERYFRWMRQLLDIQREVRDPNEFIQNLKVELYPEDVYAFTPKGLVKSFPRGATPIDFAYSVHTDVGQQCVGARINGKMVPLRSKLKNGDIVEIITQAGHKPSRDWLNFVVTSHARYEIKHWIRREEKARATELGRKLFEKEARRFDLNAKTLMDGAEFATALSEFGAQKPDDLFAAIGYGKLQPRQVFVKLVPGDKLREKAPDGPVAAVVRRVLGTGEEKIKVRGFDDLMVFRARCCNPIRGEKIVGYITRGKGVSVHSATCPNVVNLLYDPERRIEVEWDKAPGTDAAARYTVKLTMEVEDRKGLLAAVSAKIADLNTNIRNMEAHTDEGRHARLDMTVEISDLAHLEKVIKSLKSVDGVLGVERAGRAG